jgi:hypothetical protein
MTDHTSVYDSIVAALAALDPVSSRPNEVLSELVELEGVGRLIDARRAALAGEVGQLSRPELGDEGLARSENFPTAAKLLAAVTGTSVREAGSRIELGQRLRAASQLSGAAGVSPFPEVAAAMSSGALGVDAAAAITRELGALDARGVDAESVRDAEQTLVSLGCQTVGDYCFTADEITRFAVRLRDTLDPDGVAPRAERMHELRGMTMARSRDGMVRGRFALEPEQAAVWVTATHALQSPRFVPPSVPEDASATGDPTPADESLASDYVIRDARSSSQSLVDTVTDLIRIGAAAPGMPKLNGAAPTVNVHVGAGDLASGTGAAWVDGLVDPLPVAVVEQLLCHADVIPTVLGSNGRILQHGKTRRVFSASQNRALAVRDGGCIWPLCDRPPSWCETHHVEPWSSATHPPGRTDTDNGVLLCHFHHSHLHRSSWTLTMIDGAPHIIPPTWIDTSRTPRPCTRRRTAASIASRGPTASAVPTPSGSGAR